MLDEEPVLLASLRLDQRPGALQLLAVEDEAELACGEAATHPVFAFGALERAVAVLFRRIAPAVPNDDRAGPVLALRYDSFEGAVVDRVVLNHDREMLLVRVEAGALGHRPRLQRAVELQSQVVVEAARGVLVDNELERAPRPSLACRRRLGGLLQAPFLCVLLEHRPSFPRG